MPYNEHACRLAPPGDFVRFRRDNCAGKHDGKCIDFIYGFKEGGGSEVQAMRYKPDDGWTSAAARSHCESHDGTFEPARPQDRGEDYIMRNFSHSNNTADSEPSWGSVDKSSLPRAAFADQGDAGQKSTWGYPHHWIQNAGGKDENGVYTSGTMFLHKGGLNAAWAAANGARSGDQASSAVKAHLEAHRRALGLDKEGTQQQDKQDRFRGYSIKAIADTPQAEIWLYEEIGEGFFGGISAKRFADDLKKLGKLDSITVRLNSPGGDVFDGLAIFNILKQNPAQVSMFVDGLAASIASIIAMAGDEIYMAENAMMMIHKAWGISMGNADDMAQMAEALNKVDSSLVGTYARKTGLSGGRITQMMAAETWMTAQEAIDMGFADSLVPDMKMAAHFDLDKFKYRHNPFAMQPAKVEEPSPADAAADNGEPMLPDLDIFDKGLSRGHALLERIDKSRRK